MKQDAAQGSIDKREDSPFGKKLKAYLSSQEISQAKFAEKIRISPEQLSRAMKVSRAAKKDARPSRPMLINIIRGLVEMGCISKFEEANDLITLVPTQGKLSAASDDTGEKALIELLQEKMHRASLQADQGCTKVLEKEFSSDDEQLDSLHQEGHLPGGSLAALQGYEQAGEAASEDAAFIQPSIEVLPLVSPFDRLSSLTSGRRLLSRRKLLLGAGVAAGIAVVSGVIYALERTSPPPVKVSVFHVLKGHTAKVASLAFSPDGKLLASSSWDGTVRVWGADAGELQKTYAYHTDRVNSVAWSSDGRYLASGSSDGTVQVLDIDTETLVEQYSCRHKISSVAWSYDDRYLAAAGIGVKSHPEQLVITVWDRGKKLPVARYSTFGARNIHEIAWEPGSDENLAAATDYNTVDVQDINHPLPATLYAHYDQVNTVAWSPRYQSLSTQYLVAGGGNYDPGSNLKPVDTSIYVWNTSTKEKLIYQGHRKSVTSARWSPSGKYIVSGGVDNVQVWEALTGRLIVVYTGHASYQDTGVDAVAWSPTGNQIASGGGWKVTDATIHLWGFSGSATEKIV